MGHLKIENPGSGYIAASRYAHILHDMSDISVLHLKAMPLPSGLEHLRAKWIKELERNVRDIQYLAQTDPQELEQIMKSHRSSRAEEIAQKKSAVLLEKILRVQYSDAPQPDERLSLINRVHQFEPGMFAINPAIHEQYLKERAEGEPEADGERSVTPRVVGGPAVHPILGCPLR